MPSAGSVELTPECFRAWRGARSSRPGWAISMRGSFKKLKGHASPDVWLGEFLDRRGWSRTSLRDVDGPDGPDGTAHGIRKSAVPHAHRRHPRSAVPCCGVVDPSQAQAMPHRSVHQGQPAVDDEDVFGDRRSIHDALEREPLVAGRRRAADGNAFVLDAWFHSDVTRNSQCPLGVHHAVPVIEGSHSVSSSFVIWMPSS